MMPFRSRPRCATASSSPAATVAAATIDAARTKPGRSILEAHKQAFAYFGGHTRDHFYDRPRTVCQGTVGGRILWNPTFRAFAPSWGFEPRVCRGRVGREEYFKHNFGPGRRVSEHPELAGRHQLRIDPA